MDFFEKIKSTINQNDYEKNKIPISDIAHHEGGYTIVELSNNENPCGYYECFHAEKEFGSMRIVLSITTSDNYRSFGNDEEPYHNVALLYNGDNLVDKYEYTYFE